jgi:hypothetical protein
MPNEWLKNLGWGVDPYNQPNPTSLGGFQQPSQGWNPDISGWGQQTPFANQISGSRSYSFVPPQPQQPAAPTHQWMGPTPPNNTLSGTNRNIYAGTQQPTWQEQSKPKPRPAQNNDQMLYKNPGLSAQEKQGQGWAAMRQQAQVPNPKNGAFFQAAKNPLVLQAQAAAQKSFWANAYQQLNAALRPVSLPITTNNSGGGYGYPYYGWGGGGGGGYTRYAQAAPGAVWRTGQ